MGIRRKLRRLLRKVNVIMATQAQLTAQITALSDQVAKVGAETTKSLQMIADLQALIAAGGTVTPELQTAVDALAAQLKTVDDLIPDPPSP